MQADVLLDDRITSQWIRANFDFVVASSPCEEFSQFGMRCFYPNPSYPSLGIKLFNHTRELCWNSGVPWLMENVRAAQDFVGPSKHNCGPFHLWGTGVPPLLNQGIRKGKRLGSSGYKSQTGAKGDREAASLVATIPPELAACVAEYAERICEASTTQA